MRKCDHLRAARRNGKRRAILHRIAVRKKDGIYYPQPRARRTAMRRAVAERVRLEREEQHSHIGLIGRRLEEDEALKFFAHLPTVGDLFAKHLKI
jgi:hypothetical protein